MLAASMAIGGSSGLSRGSALTRSSFLPLERDIPLFYLQGGFDYSKLGRMIRILMKLIKWGLMSKKDRTPNEEAMLSAYEHPLDATKPENVRPLIDYIRSKFPIG